MFLSCVLHVSHVAMGVKLLLKIKASEMSDLGFHCSAARGGLHSRTVAAGSGAPGKLWAPWLYAGFQEGHWRPSSDTLARDRHDKPFGNEKERMLATQKPFKWIWKRNPGCSSWDTSVLFVCRRCFDLHLHCGHLGVQARSCVIQMIIFTLLNAATRMLFSLSFFFFFPSKRLLSGATCDWCKWLPLCFDVLGWTLLSPVFFIWDALSPPIILMETRVTGPIPANNNQEGLEVLGLGLENVCW